MKRSVEPTFRWITWVTDLVVIRQMTQDVLRDTFHGRLTFLYFVLIHSRNPQCHSETQKS